MKFVRVICTNNLWGFSKGREYVGIAGHGDTTFMLEDNDGDWSEPDGCHFTILAEIDETSLAKTEPKASESAVSYITDEDWKVFDEYEPVVSTNHGGDFFVNDKGMVHSSHAFAARESHIKALMEDVKARLRVVEEYRKANK